jgi:hypothetical protein
VDGKVIVMGLTRVFFGILSLGGGLLMFYFNDLSQSVRINGILGSIGPFVFLSVSAIGLIGLSAQLDPRKLAMLLAGTTLILLGTR